MTRIHTAKYESFGGKLAAFDPISNLRVGVQVLKDCIQITGSVQGGLRYYVGATLLNSDGGYVGRVLAEAAHMRGVADGKSVPVNALTSVSAVPATAPAPARKPAEEAEAADKATSVDQVALLR